MALDDNHFHPNDHKSTMLEDQSQDDHLDNVSHCLPISEPHSQSSLRPPDGGWGWVVVFASFMCNVIVDGIIFSFGILLLEISTTFKESKGKTAWIGSLQAGCYLVVGPIVSALSNKYGCRSVTICGSIIASIGFILSFRADSVLWLCITFGIIGGIGFGFVYLPAIVTVGYYFEKRRAFATGVAVCGSGIGAFIMAPVVQFLNDYYGWRGCILILSGLILNCAVFGSLFKPASETFDENLSQAEKPLLLRIKETREALWRQDEEGKQREGADEDRESEETGSPSESQDSAPPSYSAVIEAIAVSSDNGLQLQYEPNQSFDRGSKLDMNCEQNFTQNLKPFFREEIHFSALSFSPLKETLVDCIPVTLSTKSMTTPCRSGSSSCLSSSSLSSPGHPCCQPLLTIFDLTLLTSPSFLLLAFSGFLTLAGFFIPFMYIVDRAALQGIAPEKGAFLLSVIGITNTVGRVFCGYISDRPQVDALLINNIALVVGGAVTLLSPLLFNTFFSLSIYGAIFGFSIACFAALRSVITVNLLGLERLTNAFGLLLLPQGIAAIVGAPIAGWLFDVTGSYDASFYVAGTVILISGLMCFPLPHLAKWEAKRKRIM